MFVSKMMSRKTMAVLAASSVALLSAGSGAGVAFAADRQGGQEGVGAAEAVDTPQADRKILAEIPAEAGLKVHKFSEPDSSADKKVSDGREVKEDTLGAGALPLGGIEFKATKVANVDLTTNEGWQDANALVKAFKADPKSKPALETAPEFTKTVATAEGTGLADFGKLKTGLYYVEELQPTGIVKKGKTGSTEDVDGSSIVRAQPFLVAVPMVDQNDRTKWLDTVHVYPKNGIASVTKELVDENAIGAGNPTGEEAPDADNVKNRSNISYTVYGTIPAGELENFYLVDALDSRLTYRGVTGKVGEVPNNKVQIVSKDDETPVTSNQLTDADWEVVASAPITAVDDTYAQVGQVVTLKIKPSGLDKLKANPGARVQWVLQTDVNALVDPADIPNTAFLLLNDVAAGFNPATPGDNPNEDYDTPKGPNTPTPGKPGEPGEPTGPNQPKIPGVPTKTVVSKYGTVELFKFELGDKTVPLSAKFQLYTCNVDDSVKDKPKSTGLLKKVSVKGEDEWTTDATTGKIQIQGLQLNDWQNDKKVDPATWYCLVETEAPAGYEGLPEPLPFQVKTDSEAVIAKGDAEVNTKYATKVDIPNVPQNAGFNLPLTGGKGVVPLVGLGGLLVLGAGGYAAVAAKRNRKTS